MNLDDETAERIARETISVPGPTGKALVRAGYAARDAEVEELRTEVERLRDAIASTDRMTESFEKWCVRALTAEATLARVREWAEGIALQPDPPADDEMAGQINAAGDVLAILDESPTERETPCPDCRGARGYYGKGEPPAWITCRCAERETPAGSHEFEEVIVAPYVVRCAVCGKAKYPHHVPDAPTERETPADGHVHDWKRRQNVTTHGYAMPPYWACECGAAREVVADDRRGGEQVSITDEQADAAQIAFHEFVFGLDVAPPTRRDLGILRQAWKVAIEAALEVVPDGRA